MLPTKLEQSSLPLLENFTLKRYNFASKWTLQQEDHNIPIIPRTLVRILLEQLLTVKNIIKAQCKRT